MDSNRSPATPLPCIRTARMMQWTSGKESRPVQCRIIAARTAKSNPPQKPIQDFFGEISGAIFLPYF
jgi:hypothetical protein